MKTSLENILQDGKLLRQVNDLIIAHFHDNNLNRCVQGLALEMDVVFRGVAPAATHVDFGSAVIPAVYGMVPHLCFAGYKRASKSFPKHETRHVSEHKIQEMVGRPIKRTFYDHLHGPIIYLPLYVSLLDYDQVNDLDFHHQSNILISGCIVKCGMFPWTDHSIPHLYDINTIQYDAMTIWDGVTAQSVHSRVGEQGSDEATSLWEVNTGRLVKQYVGATHTQLCCQFQGSRLTPLVSLCLEYSPTESAFISCGTDRSSRLWKETL
ncbi:hypothetical protein MKW92_000267 [Papaver armeniacum]|nr:hypothetical protein MKW92_000267 [Papaver armeniacum]